MTEWKELSTQKAAPKPVSNAQAVVLSPYHGTGTRRQVGFQDCYKPQDAVCLRFSLSWMRICGGYPVPIPLLYLGYVCGRGGGVSCLVSLVHRFLQVFRQRETVSKELIS